MPDPLVAVVTPVYNGSAWIGECIESVMAQDYGRWVHVVLDNCSHDGTAEIAETLAARDDRIRVIHGPDHVPMLRNWNRALGLVPADAMYVKQLNADDALRPRCLGAMVEAAEHHPEAAIVSSYFDYGTEQRPACAHRAPLVVPGQEVVRNLFLGGPDYLAQPSVLLLRRACAEAWPDLFEPSGFPPGHPDAPPLCQADKEAYLPILAQHDLVFVPECLTEIRVAEETATAYSSRVAAWHAGWLELLLRHGDRFLSRPDAARGVRRSSAKYVRSLTWRFCKAAPWRDEEFVRYQHLALSHLRPSLRDAGYTTATAALGPFAAIVAARYAGERESR